LTLLPTLCLTGCSGCSIIPPQNHQTEAQVSTPVDDQSGPEKTASKPKSPPATTISFDRAPSNGSAGSETNGTDVDRDDNPSTSRPSSTSPTTLGKSSNTGHPPADPDATIKNVGKLREKAKNAAGKNDFGRAFSLSSQAWEEARAYPKDLRLRQIAEDLASEMESFGNRANSQFGNKSASSTTRMVEK